MTGPAINLEEAAPGISRRAVPWLVAFLVCLWAVQCLDRFLPRVFREDQFNLDAQQHVWWTYRFADPALFPNDPIADFMSGPQFAPPGYKALYRLFVPHVDAQVLSELIPMALSALLMGAAFLLGRACGGGSPIAGFAAAIIVAMDQIYFGRLQGGFPRSFGLVISVFAMWALIDRRLGWLGFAFLVAALFYPPSLLSPAMSAAAVLGWQVVRDRKLPRSWPVLLGIGLLALTILVMGYVHGLPPQFGPVTTAAQAREMPDFQIGGRAEFFYPSWIDYLFDNSTSGIGLSITQVSMLAGGIAASMLIFGRRVIPVEAWVFLGMSVFTFILAHLMLFVLFVPNRHMRYPLLVFQLIWLSVLVVPALRLVQPRLNMNVPWRRIAAGVSIVLILGLGIDGIFDLRQELAEPIDRDQEAAYDLLEKLPPDTLVAAHPDDADAIPLRTRRSVLAFTEILHPYWMGYYQLVSPRIAAELKACYATDFAEVEDNLDDYGVDVFLVNTDRYTDERSIRYFQPYTAANQQMVEQGRRRGFAPLNPPADRILGRFGKFIAVRI